MTSKAGTLGLVVAVVSVPLGCSAVLGIHDIPAPQDAGEAGVVDAPQDSHPGDARARDGGIDVRVPSDGSVTCNPPCDEAHVCSPNAGPACVPLAPLPNAFAGVTAISLPDGRILVIGSGGVLLVYDPVANSWTNDAGPPMPNADWEAEGALGHDGVVYVFTPANGRHLEGYSLATQTWFDYPAPPGNQNDDGVGATAPDGTIYFLGGGGYGGGVDESYCDMAYDPVAKTWQTSPACGGGSGTLPDQVYRQVGPTALVGDDGTVYLAGGYWYSWQDPQSLIYYVGCENCAEVLAPGASKWMQIGGPANASSPDYCGTGKPGTGGDEGAGGALGADGRFYTFGGWIGFDGPPQPNISALDLKTQMWTKAGVMLTPRAHAGVALGLGPDGKHHLYVIGGETGIQDPNACSPGTSNPVTTVEAYTFW